MGYFCHCQILCDNETNHPYAPCRTSVRSHLESRGERTVTINDTVYVILKAEQVKPVAPIHDTIYVAAEREKRFTIGGYGEAVASRNFYSDAWQRYATPPPTRTTVATAASIFPTW